MQETLCSRTQQYTRQITVLKDQRALVSAVGDDQRFCTNLEQTTIVLDRAYPRVVIDAKGMRINFDFDVGLILHLLGKLRGQKVGIDCTTGAFNLLTGIEQ